MSFSNIKAAAQFIKMHSELLRRLYILDLLYLFISIWFLVFDISLVDPIRLSTFLFLFCLFFTKLNIRVIVQNIAGVNYYRLLPIRSFSNHLLSHAAVNMPFVISLFAAGMVILALRNSLPFLSPLTLDSFLLRSGCILLIFCSIKYVSLPTFLLSQRHPAALFAYYLTLIPIATLVLMFDEFFYQHLPLHQLWEMGQFVLSLILLQLFIFRMR